MPSINRAVSDPPSDRPERIDAGFVEEIVLHAQRVSFVDGVGEAFAQIWPMVIDALEWGAVVDEEFLAWLQVAQRRATAAAPAQARPVDDARHVAPAEFSR